MRSGYRQSRLVIHSQIKYKKSVWGIVKSMSIESIHLMESIEIYQLDYLVT